ncbi:hypothetical protein M747DRAFT_236729 [Aspergillus niger ATCC 13496]|uniref:Uncharacterized protein n=2 Tax=Aspergillus niger TaxID=5061 RepID=A2QYH0_ASPNC|nr:hypothetical protein An12g01200 [Aspergillus niger]RDH20768.1 hypothetical protein M747DRAFT_236729 [Aspergillus niger ATCC 13496]CAK41050.1 hypothetical protein An12g01200 [Aspergillus niger]
MEFVVANFTLACGLDRHTLAKLDRGSAVWNEDGNVGINMHANMRVSEVKLDGMVLPLLEIVKWGSGSWKAGWQVGRPLKLYPARAQIMVSRSHPMEYVHRSDVQAAPPRLQERLFLIPRCRDRLMRKSTVYSIKCNPTITSTLSTSITQSIIPGPSAQHPDSTFSTRPSCFRGHRRATRKKNSFTFLFLSPSHPQSFLTLYSFFRAQLEFRRPELLSDIFAICGPEPVNRRALPFGFAAASGSAALSHPRSRFPYNPSYVHLSELLAATSDPRCITTSVSELTAVRTI